MQHQDSERKRLVQAGVWIAGLALVVYGADAVYPSWDFSCGGHALGSGLYVGPSRVPELEADPSARVLNPTVPDGCEVHAHNFARRIYDGLTAK